MKPDWGAITRVEKLESMLESAASPGLRCYPACPALAATMADAAKSMKKQGDKCFKDSQFQEAIERYTEAIAAGALCQKDTSKCYANRGACWLKMKDYGQVIADCSAAVSIDPKYISALLRRATAYEATSELAKARADLNQLLGAEPDNAKALKLLTKVEEAAISSTAGSFVGSGAAEPEIEMGAPDIKVRPAPAGGFDEGRLLKDGEWEEWDALMEADETSGDQAIDANLEALIDQQMQEARAEILNKGAAALSEGAAAESS